MRCTFHKAAVVVISSMLFATSSTVCRGENIERTDTAISTSPGIISSIGVDMKEGYVFNSGGFSGYENACDYRELHNLTSFGLKYVMRFAPSTSLGRDYPGAYQGIGLGVNTFYGHSAIGTPVSLYIFQGAPVKRFSPRFSLLYEWNLGASFGWHRFSEPEGMKANIITGSRVNVLLGLSFMLDCDLGRGFSLRAGVEGVHFSNGNTAIPNPGINSLGARIGVVYTPGWRGTGESATDEVKEPFRPHFSYDILAYGSAHKQLVDISDSERVQVPGSFGVAGISVAPMYEFSRYFRAGVSADFKYDEASDLDNHLVEGSTESDMHFYRQPFKDCLTGGLSARIELVMPIFSINGGIGYNMLGVSANRHLYQTLNLRTHITRRLWLNVGYQLHNFSKPDNLILGLGYTFH